MTAHLRAYFLSHYWFGSVLQTNTGWWKQSIWVDTLCLDTANKLTQFKVNKPIVTGVLSPNSGHRDVKVNKIFSSVKAHWYRHYTFTYYLFLILNIAQHNKAARKRRRRLSSEGKKPSLTCLQSELCFIPISGACCFVYVPRPII